MVDEIDIYRAAKVLIDQHGVVEAWRVAIQRAVELAGDTEGRLQAAARGIGSVILEAAFEGDVDKQQAGMVQPVGP